MTVGESFAQCIIDLKLNNGSEKTARNYKSVSNSLLSVIGDIPIELLTVEHVTRWRLYRERMGHRPSTIALDISRLRQVLKFLKRRGMNVLDYDMIDRPKVQKGPPTYLIPAEVQQIIDVIPNKRDRAIFACMFDSGARVSELLNIDLEDVTGDTARIIGKGSKPGTLHFGPWSMNYLQDYLESRRDGLRPLFVSGQYRRITVSRVEQLLHLYADRAGINKNVTPHVLRHSFATDLKRNGADIYDVKIQLRHERISSTEIYLHIEDNEKATKYHQFHTDLLQTNKRGHK